MSNYFELQNAPVLTTPSALTAPKITSIGYPGDDTAADPAGGQTITLTGEGFEAGASVIVNNAAVGVVSVVSSTSITFTSPALSTGSYPVYVVNTDGGTAIAVPGIQYSGTPNWTTAAGSLGSYTETQAISNTVTATGDAPITYSLFSGTLPTGATLNSANGLISGTSPLSASPTTYTFTIRATDAQQQDTNRQFSLTINPDVVTWSSPANGTTYTSTANSAISNVALSATAASGQSVSYTANALPTGLSLSGSNITGTPTVVANSSTLLTATAATTNATATRTINWVISVANDPDFEYVTTLLSASNPASTFVSDASTNNFAVSVFGDTRPNNFGPYTPGYYSNFFDGSGDWLGISASAEQNLGTSDFTYEFFWYPTTLGSRQALFCAATDYWFGIDFQSDGKGLGLWASSTGSSWNLINADGGGNGITSTSPVINTWNHIAVSRTSGTWSMWLNGSRILNLTGITSAVVDRSSDPKRIGTWAASFGFPLNGYISNSRLVIGTAIYNPTTASITVPTSPLTAVANTKLLTCQSNRFIDNSTNAFTITRNGDVTVNGFDPFAPLSAYSTYGSGYFDGNGDYLALPANSNLAVGSGDFTIECWIYLPTTLANDVALFESRPVDLSATGFTLGLVASGLTIQFYSNSRLVNTTGIGINRWYHIALTRAGTALTIYIDGVSAGTGSSNQNYTDTAFKIGQGVWSPSSFPGYISDFRLVKGTAVYTSAFTPPAAPLTAVANTQLLTLQNNQPNNNNMFLDSSTNNFLITRNGNTTQGSFSPYGGGWSNYFDGNGDFLSIASNTAFAFGTGDFTVEAWIMRTGGSSTQAICQSDAVGSSTNDKWFFAVSGTGLIFSTHDAGGFSGTTTTTFNIGVWYHVAASRSSGTLRMFVNGVNTAFAATGNPSGYNLGQNGFSIGAVSTPIYWTGYISNLRVTKGTALYTSTFTPSTTPLTPVANTSLLTCADNRFVDDSGNNFTITRNGDVSVQRFNPFNPVLTAPTSYSGYFDGSGDYLTFNGSSSMAFGTGDFTIECWVNIPSIAAYNTIIDARPSDGAVPYALSITNSGTLAWYNGSADVVSTSALSINAWTHIAISRSGTTLRFFINGVAAGSSTDSINYSSTNSATRIGANLNTATNPYRGYISNLRVVKGTAVYTSAFTPSTTPLTAIANTSLLTLQNATFIDNSTNNFTLTANGNSQPTQFNPFGWTSTTGGSAAYSVANYGGSMYFDGSGDFLSLAGNTAFTMPGNFTAEAWVYCNGYTNDYAAIFGFSNDSENRGWNILVRTNGRLHFNVAMTFTDATGTLPLNQWTHVALVRSGSGSGNVKLYVNGVADATTLTVTATATSPSTVMLGSYPGITSRAFNGYISNARIVKGTAVYTSNFAPAVAPLSFNANATLLANGTGAAIYDSSMIATYETLGNAQSTGVIKKYGNSSMYFDGSGDWLQTRDPVGLGGANFTIEFWGYNLTGTSNWGVFSIGATLGADFAGITMNGGGGLFLSTTGSSWTYSNVGSITLSSNDNQWHHYAIVRNDGSLLTFKDGVQQATVSISGSLANNAGTILFGRKSDSTNTTSGYIDDLRITRGVARYIGNFTPPTSPFMQN